MPPELKQLHDIAGLDPISWWPLSTVSWICLSSAILLLASLAYYVARRVAFKRSWKNDTFEKLATLEKNLSETTAKETAIILSEYLRRIALRRFTRKECAGLVGDAWLKWLTVHDPKGFDWEQKGSFLMDAPYAPAEVMLSTSQIKDLIQAIRNWVR
jgi:uncharacterized protein YfaT (DUF1175 family)